MKTYRITILSKWDSRDETETTNRRTDWSCKTTWITTKRVRVTRRLTSSGKVVLRRWGESNREVV